MALLPTWCSEKELQDKINTGLKEIQDRINPVKVKTVKRAGLTVSEKKTT